MRIYIGTSGYSYNDWVGPFYPEKTKKSDFFPYYAERFHFTELNFPYYKQPMPFIVEKIRNKAPDGFQFAVKAHKSLTHEQNENWKQQADTYLKGLEPLTEADMLAAVLLQFPYGFHYNFKNRTYLASLCDKLSDIPLCIEFRNTDWLKKSVTEELHTRGIPQVFSDYPQLKGLPPLPSIPSQKALGENSEKGPQFRYIRFHGRNKKNWWQGDATTRYDYLYSQQELQPWVDIVQSLKNTDILYVAFNNHYNAQAVQNAFMLKDMLSGTSGVEVF